MRSGCGSMVMPDHQTVRGGHGVIAHEVLDDAYQRRLPVGASTMEDRQYVFVYDARQAVAQQPLNIGDQVAIPAERRSDELLPRQWGRFRVVIDVGPTGEQVTRPCRL